MRVSPTAQKKERGINVKSNKRCAWGVSPGTALLKRTRCFTYNRQKERGIAQANQNFKEYPMKPV